MILIVNICADRLHYFELVKPIEDIVRGEGKRFFTRHYLDLKKGDLMNCKKVIICGTSLKDNKFVEDLGYFHFLRDKKFSKPVLGICGGMQIIGLCSELNRQVVELDIKSRFGHVLKKKTEIGYFKEKFDEDFLGLMGEVEVYHLHNNYVSGWDGWDVFCRGNGVVQAVRRGNFFGVLFHPEVRNKEMIRNFLEEVK